MSDRYSEGFMMIGLHKLAAQNGDGMVPELYDLLNRQTERARSYENIRVFPFEDTRRPGVPPLKSLGADAKTGANVVAFVSPAGQNGVISGRK